MKVSLVLPDELWEKYAEWVRQQQALLGNTEEPTEAQVQALLVQTLAFWSGVDPGDRVVVLAGPTRAAAEKLLGKGSVLGPEDFLAKLEGLVKISVGEVRMDLTLEQVAQLKRHADKRGISYEEALRQGVRFVEGMVAWG